MTIPFATALTINRRTDGDYSSGVWSDGGTSATTVQAHVQPDNAAGGQMMNDSDGQRWIHSRVQVYSESVLYASGENSGYKADQFSWNGGTYEVVSVAYYDTTTPIPHWSCVAELIDGNVI